MAEINTSQANEAADEHVQFKGFQCDPVDVFGAESESKAIFQDNLSESSFAVPVKGSGTDFAEGIKSALENCRRRFGL